MTRIINKAYRNEQICQALEHGSTPTEVARKFGLMNSSICRIYKEMRGHTVEEFEAKNSTKNGNGGITLNELRQEYGLVPGESQFRRRCCKCHEPMRDSWFESSMHGCWHYVCWDETLRTRAHSGGRAWAKAAIPHTARAKRGRVDLAL